ncbi:hybrid sensor histidine kinase/response regulator transcription factor [Bacteroides sp. 51]|uniref:hybrid sensor histidine kinase/response regulator transcription factor n=1 Tax=Bacteroides sp. 51 TaxID=2302938 RepID=UPI0013D0C9CC|nr:hybrid sensor histidine kinase/response regulator transcription factor [Bacteroides sp. 51]NDV83974.1 hybrid sensor histidine kinase/response regulator [Bacteroides sp. 51]
MKRIKILYALLLLTFCLQGFAVGNKNFHFRKIQVDDGLSENTVYCILQDSKGFMWFGTKDGLNRYDGSNFRVFRHSVLNPSSLGNNFIRSIAEGPEGVLYIGTDIGLYIMDTVHETFIPVTLETLEGKRLTTAVNTLLIDRDGKLWIGSMYQGTFIYDPAQQTLRQVEVKNYNLGQNAVWTIYGDRSGTIWVGTRLGLLRYNAGAKELEAVDGLFSPLENSDHEVLTILEDTKGSLWLGTWSDGVRFYDRQRYYNTSYLGLQSETDYITHVRALYQYDNTHILIGSDDGLYLFDMESKESRRVDIPQSYYSMSDQNVYSIASDREGGIWIGTYFGGINYLDVFLLPVETYYADVKHGMLSGKAVSQFCEDANGNMWIATEDGGVNHFDVRTKRITQPIQTSYHNTHALLLDDDNLWIGTFSRGVDVYNTRTGKLLNYRSNVRDEFTLNDDCIFSLYRTKNGDIYAGTPVGLNKYDRSTDRFVRITEVTGFIYDVREDDLGNLWVATYGNGVVRLDGKTGKWMYYDQIISSDDPVVGSKLTSIYIDGQKRLIFSSEGRGIFVYDYQTDKFRNISETEGLPNNVVYGVLDDPFGNLWLSCNKGIVCFDIQTPANYKLYNKEDGLQSNQFNYKSSYKTRDGKFYFGGINGFSCFYPQDLSQLQNTHIPSVEITGVRLLGDSKGQDADIQILLNKQQRIVFPHYKSSFTISYISLSYQSQNKNEYAYMLEGVDKDWTPAGNNKSVTYVNLRPGEYSFKVKASNNSGVWNEEGAQIDIEILPPFWLSLPARLLYLLLSIVLIYSLISYFWKKHKEKQTQQLYAYKTEQEKLAFKSKIDFFTNIAHEIRTPVSLIKAPLEEVIALGEGSEDTKHNLFVIEKNCNRLSVLINQLLDFRKMDSTDYHLNPEAIDLKNYMTELYERFKKTVVSRDIEFTLSLPNDSVGSIIFDSDVLTKIIGNLLTNAMKFTRDKIILTMVVNEDQSYTVTVEDNGKGIPDDLKKLVFDPFYQIEPDSNKVGTGIGLSLVKKLAKIVNGKVTVVDGGMGGALFSFTFSGLSKELPEQKNVTDSVPAVDAAAEERPEVKERDKNAVLVVDDNPDITSFIKKVLERDYVVDTALDANTAWRLLEERGYDLIISDIMMPDVDGITFTKRIKADLNYSHIPVILLSAKTENAVKIEGLRSGAEVFMEKPFSTSFLKAQILSLLENRRTLLEAFNRSPLASYSMLATNRGDEVFLNKLNEEIEKNLSDETFSVESLTDVLGISRSNLQRKLKAICAVTPGEYLRNYRLKKACKLLLEGDMRINEVAFYVGFSSASYFAKVFIKCYDMSPKEFIRRNSLDVS